MRSEYWIYDENKKYLETIYMTDKEFIEYTPYSLDSSKNRKWYYKKSPLGPLSKKWQD